MRQTWIYTARDAQGNRRRGEIEGESREQVMRSISERGLIPTRVAPRSEKTTLATILGNFGSANRENLIIFTRQLMTLHRAGIPLLRALGSIQRGAGEIGMKVELEDIRNNLRAGLPLSKALGRLPKKFPPIYVASIAAGEASGKLDDVLEQLALLVEKEMILARQVKSALRYPLMVILAIAVAVMILMSFVIPRFTSLYGKFGADLPLPTKLVMTVSQAVSSYWIIGVAALAVAALVLKKVLATKKGRLRWDKTMLKIPLVGDLMVKANIARFAAMLKILYRSGVPMVACLNILSDTTANKAIAGEINLLGESFEKGQEIGPDPHRYHLIPAMALEMFQVGLESGSVESIMGDLATHYEMELEYRSRHLTALLEPVLTAAIGIMVLILALSIFLPMWNLIKVFK